MNKGILAEAKDIVLIEWTWGADEDGVEYTLDDFHGYTLVVYRGNDEVKWGAEAISGTYDNPQHTVLKVNSVERDVAMRNALYWVAEKVSEEIRQEELADAIHDARDTVYDALLAQGNDRDGVLRGVSFPVGWKT